MTNLINISFAALLVTNAVTSSILDSSAWTHNRDFDRSVTKRTDFTITSNYVSHVAIDGKTNTITLDCATNNQWTVETKLEWVSKTNGEPPVSVQGRLDGWFNSGLYLGSRVMVWTNNSWKSVDQ